MGASCKYKKDDLVGVYINNYSERMNKRMIPPEAPGKKDTLVLFDNNTFVSSSFGNGSYTIQERDCTQIVHLSYKEGNILAGYGLTVKRKYIFNHTPVLEIDVEGEYYYKKLLNIED